MYEKQMELFQDGGLYQEGGMVDEESGNEVPAGSTRREVRDDIPAMLSEGEFVFPADVVRFIGLDNLMKMRQKAKAGLSTMEDMGQMGNSEEAELPDDMPFDISELMTEDDDTEDEVKGYKEGGLIKAGAGGGMGGVMPMLEYITYVGPDGTKAVIPSLNGTPIYPVPTGYTKEGATAETPTEPTAPTDAADVNIQTTQMLGADDNGEDAGDFGGDRIQGGWDRFANDPDGLANEVDKLSSNVYKGMMGAATAVFGPVGPIFEAANISGGINAVNTMLASGDISAAQRKRLVSSLADLNSKKKSGILGDIGDAIAGLSKEDLPEQPTKPTAPTKPTVTTQQKPSDFDFATVAEEARQRGMATSTSIVDDYKPPQTTRPVVDTTPPASPEQPRNVVNSLMYKPDGKPGVTDYKPPQTTTQKKKATKDDDNYDPADYAPGRETYESWAEFDN